MKKTNAYENLTMDEIRNLLDEKVDAWNDAVELDEKISLEVDMADLTQKYNELSMLNVYATCLADAQPVVAFVKTYYYHVLSVKKTVCSDIGNDGKKKSYVVCSIKETDNNGEKLVKELDLVKFIEWTATRNKLVAAEKDWKSKMNTARKVINSECEKQVNSKDGYKISKTKIKKALQDMFNSLVFIKSEKGNNAVIANGKTAGLIVHLAADLKTENVKGSPEHTFEFLRDKKWHRLVMQFLNMAVTGKDFSVVYGEPENEVADKVKNGTTDKKADTKAEEAKTEAESK